MSARDSLSNQQFKYLYHEAPGSVRESIRSKGLIPHKPFTPQVGEDVYPHGVYMSTPKGSEYGSGVPGHDAPYFGYDRWRVNVAGLNVERDPDPLHTTSFMVKDQIPPERLTLAKKAHPDWEKHI
jgi:hypothetical protein